jgi:hypothetical protein
VDAERYGSGKDIEKKLWQIKNSIPKKAKQF